MKKLDISDDSNFFFFSQYPHNGQIQNPPCATSGALGIPKNPVSMATDAKTTNFENKTWFLRSYWLYSCDPNVELHVYVP